MITSEWWCHQNYINERCNKKDWIFEGLEACFMIFTVACLSQWMKLLMVLIFTFYWCSSSNWKCFWFVPKCRWEQRRGERMQMPIFSQQSWHGKDAFQFSSYSLVFLWWAISTKLLGKAWKKVASGLFTILVKESEKSKSRPKNRKLLFKKMEKKSILKVL